MVTEDDGWVPDSRGDPRKINSRELLMKLSFLFLSGCLISAFM